MRNIIIIIAIIIVVGIAQAGKLGGIKSARKISSHISKPKPIKEYHIKVKPTSDHQEAKTREALVANMMEDRQGDWLARQMREERKLLEKGDLLDLGASHSKKCTAKEIKLEHILEHDDSIDNGEA